VLEVLNLENNQLSGAIPDFLGDLPLQVLRLSGNDWDEGTLGFVYGITTLEDLRLDETNRVGSVDAAIGDLVNLERLEIHANQLEGELPEEIGACEAMTYLDIEFNLFSGPIPASIGNMQNLVEFYLSGNDFEGAMPDEICAIELLEFLVPDCSIDCSQDCCTNCNDGQA